MTCSYELILKTKSPVAVLGASIEVTAELYDNGKLAPDGQDQYRYTWRDNAIRTHKSEEIVKRATANWTVSYPADQFSPGKYTIELEVERFVLFYYYTLTSSRLEIELTCTSNSPDAIALCAYPHMCNAFSVSMSPYNSHVKWSAQFATEQHRSQ